MHETPRTADLTPPSGSRPDGAGGPSRLLRAVTVPLMLLVGAVLALQAEVNGRFAQSLGTGSRAGIAVALVGFVIALAILAPLVAVRPGPRADLVHVIGLVRSGEIPHTSLVGGLLGAFYITSQGIAAGVIGVALFNVAVTAGQSVSGLLVDHAGLGPGGRQAWGLPRVVAATAALAAVVMATAERLVEAPVGATLLLAGLPLVAGAGLSVQQALNGRVALRVGPLVTTFVNFVVGALGLSVALLGSLALPGQLAGLPDVGWLYVGGPLGIVYIWLAALLVRVHGVLVLGMAIIAGQVVTAVVIEWVTGTHVGPFGYLAAVVVVAGVTVAVRMKRQA